LKQWISSPRPSFTKITTYAPEAVTGFLPAKHLCSPQSCHIVFAGQSQQTRGWLADALIWEWQLEICFSVWVAYRVQSESYDVIIAELHCFFPLVLTKLIFINFFTSLNTFKQEGYFLTNLDESDTREVW
jgi:hypothetical protein